MGLPTATLSLFLELTIIAAARVDKIFLRASVDLTPLLIT
jgi:hypothetical protein